jgi:hypothetical protein
VLVFDGVWAAHGGEEQQRLVVPMVSGGELIQAAELGLIVAVVVNW